MSPVGKTKSQGWEIGVRRTLPVSTGEAWEALMTQPGMGYWLGHGVRPVFKKGMFYKTDEGAEGQIRSYDQGHLIRLTWQPPDWEFASTLQLRVLPAKTGATISFHHEKLADGNHREATRAHWMAVMDKLEKLVMKG